MTQGVFVTATGTGVGKTVVCACLVRRWGAAYWKPVQTGVATEDADSVTVGRLAPGVVIHPPRHVFQAPLSPEAAGALEGVRVELADFDVPVGSPIVVEGAGGVMVPLNGQSLMIDLMVRLRLPVVVVAGTGLGTINHTLLSLAALRARDVAIAGVVLVGAANEGNREAIARHGEVRVLGWVPWLASVTARTVAEASARLPSWQDIRNIE